MIVAQVRQAGYSLIEVLIALVILSVGLLGLAALQGEGLRSVGTASIRFQAVQLIEDITASMAANPDGVAELVGGAFVQHYLVDATGTGNAAHACADGLSTNSANDCTAQQMAQFDVSLWKTSLAARLPGGNGTIVATTNSFGAASNDDFIVTITWTERGDTKSLVSQVTLDSADTALIKLP